MMRVQMMVTKVVDAPPRGRVVYPRGALVNVPENMARGWMNEQPIAARDPNVHVEQKTRPAVEQVQEVEPWREP